MICKLMGEVDSNNCYDCFKSDKYLTKVEHPHLSRVLCKRDNVAGEVKPVVIATPVTEEKTETMPMPRRRRARR